jgi:hypothetical protein
MRSLALVAAVLSVTLAWPGAASAVAARSTRRPPSTRRRRRIAPRTLLGARDFVGAAAAY